MIRARRLTAIFSFLALTCTLLACGATGGDGSVDQKLHKIGASYHSCVSQLGADSQPCKMMENGIAQLATGADQFDSAASTANAIKMEEQGRRSLGFSRGDPL